MSAETVLALAPGLTAIVLTMIGLAVAVWPPERMWARITLGIVVLVLGILTAVTMFINQSALASKEADRVNRETERDLVIENMKGQVDAMVRQGAPQEETKRAELWATTIKDLIASCGRSGGP